MIITLQLSISFAAMEEEIVGVSVKLNQVMRVRFPNIVMHSFEFSEA